MIVTIQWYYCKEAFFFISFFFFFFLLKNSNPLLVQNRDGEMEGRRKEQGEGEIKKDIFIGVPGFCFCFLNILEISLQCLLACLFLMEVCYFFLLCLPSSFFLCHCLWSLPLILETFSCYFLKYLFFSTLSFFSFWDSNYKCVWKLDIVHSFVPLWFIIICSISLSLPHRLTLQCGEFLVVYLHVTKVFP